MRIYNILNEKGGRKLKKTKMLSIRKMSVVLIVFTLAAGTLLASVQ